MNKTTISNPLISQPVPGVHLDNRPTWAPEYQPLYPLLYRNERPTNGTWIPFWLSSYSHNEAFAMVLAELLGRCMILIGNVLRRELISINSLRLAPREHSRVRVHDDNRHHWLEISTGDLGAQTMVTESTLADALTWAVDKGLLVIERHDHNLLRIRPIGKAVAQAFEDDTGLEVFPDPVSEMDLSDQWRGSVVQLIALHHFSGVFVHKAFLVALRGDHFLARLLSYIVAKVADSEGYERDLFTDREHRWLDMTAVYLSLEFRTTIPEVQRGIEVLETAGLIETITEPSVLNYLGRNASTILIRPDIPNILALIRKSKRRKTNEKPDASTVQTDPIAVAGGGDETGDQQNDSAAE